MRHACSTISTRRCWSRAPPGWDPLPTPSRRQTTVGCARGLRIPAPSAPRGRSCEGCGSQRTALKMPALCRAKGGDGGAVWVAWPGPRMRPPGPAGPGRGGGSDGAGPVPTRRQCRVPTSTESGARFLSALGEMPLRSSVVYPGTVYSL